MFGVDPESGTAAEWAAQEAFYLRGDTIDEMGGAGFELCAGTPTDEMTADLVAPGFVRQVRLPAIEPRIDPGFAITGLPAYLVVENQDDFLYSTDIPGWGTLAADFRLERVEVDWGDGTDPQIYTDGRRGAPYDGPAGLQISHDYRNVDTDNQVEVTTTWSAEWSLAGASGTVAGMSTTTDLELPIREYRAVRVAP
ncbi:MAG: hypothetical protein JJT89_01415 [Nitriliruptoraceae bacterium]|nr:hypothetical protein [Nitriliruptoraceae bacterium]